MEGSKLGYRVWALVIYLLATSLKGLPSKKLHRDLGITQKSAWHLAHRIHKSFEANYGPFEGPIEIDETYIGGKERNKHESDKPNACRGAVGKTAIVGIKDRETNQVVASPVPGVTQANVESLIHGTVGDDAMVYTDDSSAYNCLEKRESVNHSAREYVRGMAHTNGIESFGSMLKRGYYGTYHKMSVKHLNRYASEFAGRHNVRVFDTVDQMCIVACGLDGKKLRLRELAYSD